MPHDRVHLAEQQKQNNLTYRIEIQSECMGKLCPHYGIRLIVNRFRIAEKK